MVSRARAVIRPAVVVLIASVCGTAACGSSERDHFRGGAGAAAGVSGSGGTGGAGGAGGRGGAGGTGGVATGGVGGDVVPPPPMDGGMGDPECQREVSLEAVTLGEPAPFDLIIVADHSGSLSWSKDELSAGLDELLTRVEGRSVRTFLLTPTQYGESSSPALSPLLNEPVVPWQDPDTGAPYENPVTDYSQVCTSPEGAVIDCPSPLGPDPYHVEGAWTFLMPDPIAEIRPDMTDTEFRAEQDTVAQAILAIGGTGSPNEQPLCTLARYAAQDPSVLPENAMFLLISDEDDVSLPKECLVGWHGDVRLSQNENGTSPCSADCDAYRFTMTGDLISKGYTINCAAFDDMGNKIEGSDQMHYASQSGLPSCDGINPGPCTGAEEQSIAWVCETGKVITSCDVECAMTPDARCNVDLHDPNVNACTDPFTYQGQNWENLPDYCASKGTGFRDCMGGGIYIEYSQSLSGGSSIQSLMPGTTTADIGRYFRALADSHFEPGAYLVEAIAFDPAFSCELGTGQSHATNIVSFVADPSRVFPLCEPYSAALDGVWDFAQALIQTTFTLDLKADETVTEVIVIDQNGSERALSSSDYTYDRDTMVLTISRSAIRGTDATLRVEVTSDCRPVIR